MSNKIRAAVLTELKELEIREFEKPKLGPEDILLKVILCGICGSDIHFWKGTLGMSEAFILGHEFIGEIAEAGDKALKERDLLIGDLVAVEILIPCYHCNWCKEEKYHLCGEDDTSQTGKKYGRQFGCNIPLTREPTPLWGGFSQYIFIPREAIIHKYKKGVNIKAAVMTEPFSTAIHAIERANPLIGESCAILGPGTIGLCLTIAAKLKGLYPIILIGSGEKDDYRLELGKKLGADYIINLSDESKDTIALIRNVVQDTGVDISIDASGTSAAQILGIKILKRGGRTVLVGISNKRSINIIPDTDLVFKETTIFGSILNKGYRKAVKLIESKKVPLDKLLTHEFSLDSIEEAFRFVSKRKDNVIKAVINPWKTH